MIAEPPPKRKGGRPKKKVEPEPIPEVNILPPTNVVMGKLREIAAKAGISGVSSKPMGEREANERRNEVITALQLTADLIDFTLSHSNRAHRAIIIWALDDDDAGKIADKLLATARLSGAVAYGIRLGAAGADWVEIVKIIGPRMLATFDFYAKSGGIGF